MLKGRRSRLVKQGVVQTNGRNGGSSLPIRRPPHNRSRVTNLVILFSTDQSSLAVVPTFVVPSRPGNLLPARIPAEAKMLPRRNQPQSRSRCVEGVYEYSILVPPNLSECGLDA